ncbi:sensor histidine kinase [Neolewinella agarilytica]|uniref:histidine kinase n=1 Tax=Neolewinella agarilytica TaxID=478744 RepID=A0A1H8Z5J4_9BACT|nr:sensor histidine kinase [Neolewinella agarilytica]SEP59623.1 Signal transduction histidine kinase [Neolewinella agarilytica]
METNEISAESVNILLAGIVGMLLLSVALVVFFIVYQRRIFEQQRIRLAEEQAHQKQLLTAAVEVQETERRRIARDLHDDIGSLLSATRLYLRQLKPDSSPEKSASIRAESLSILDEIIQNTRRITHDLLPPVLEKFGYQAAAEDLCERVGKSGGMKMIYSGGSNQRRLEDKQEIALYRVLQELVNNTLKHAKASEIEVVNSWQGDLFKFRYRDDGKGFDPLTVKSGGLGLKNIESRITLVGGSLDWKSAPGDGLEVNISLNNAN